MLYFAYGSNLDEAQMRERCPCYETIGRAFLPDHVLCFPRASAKRGCGVSSVQPAPGQAVWGVIYRLTPDDVVRLDRNEGYRPDRAPSLNRYNRIPVTVMMAGVETATETYVARREDNPPLPNLAYLSQIREGARAHGLPEEYLARLAALAAADPAEP